MDDSEKYIKMSEKAEEIQALHEEETIYGRDCYVRGAGIKNPIWLPQQDQLQEMVKDKLIFRNFEWTQTLNGLYKMIYDDNQDTCVWGNSMEQLWLAFVMYEKYQKIWDDEKEEWITKE